jgi:hypothetical protein
MQGRPLYGLIPASCCVHGIKLTFAVNNFLLTPSEKAGVAHLPVTEAENATLALANAYVYGGTGYMLEQGTKPGAISLVLMSNPLAMLGW